MRAFPADWRKNLRLRLTVATAAVALAATGLAAALAPVDAHAATPASVTTTRITAQAHRARHRWFTAVRCLGWSAPVAALGGVERSGAVLIIPPGRY